MAEAVAARLDAIRNDLRGHLGFTQPGLQVDVCDGIVVVSGTYYLTEDSGPSPDGPLSEYQIKLELDPRYPAVEPRLFETSGRIPVGRHLNGDGTCCTCVWEEWLATTPSPTTMAYIDGPLKDYFLSQYHFELTEEWPFGEREHGLRGIIDGCADALGIEGDPKIVLEHIRFLAHADPKGHWPCPCQSGLIVRKCHGERLFALREKVSPELATQMLERIQRALSCS